MKAARIAVLAAALCGLGAIVAPGHADAGNHVFEDLLARPIYRKSFSLPKLPFLQRYTFSTSDLVQLGPWAPDTVIVVQKGASSWSNDNCSSTTTTSCVTTSGAAGTYVVTVFAALPYSYGTFDLKRRSGYSSPVTVANNAQFGGSIIALSVPTDGSYAFQTVHTPGGATNTVAMLLSSSKRYKAYDNDSGIGAAAKIVATPAAGDYLLVGSYSASTMGQTQATTVVINPCTDEETSCHAQTSGRASGGDSDGDWLSNKVEQELGTSPYDKDSDDDGIFDYYEVIGHKVGSAELTLPYYGANPRRADIFIELDRADGANVTAAQPFVQILQEIFLDLPRWSNPDGTTGIRIHVDGGVACASGTLCGNWGGSEVYEHSCNTMPSADTVRDHFAPVRRGIFRYTLRTCGAQGQLGGTISRIGPNNTEDEAEIWAQEIAHNLGLSNEHSGDSRDPADSRLNQKGAYPSLGNYAYQNSIPGVSERSRFSEGRLDPLDGAGTRETGYSPGRNKNHLAASPYWFSLSGDTLDLNRDGRITSNPVMFDSGPQNLAVTGAWPEIYQLRDVTTDPRAPTGGAGIVVQPLQAGGVVSRVFVVAPFAHSNGVYPEITATDDYVDAEPGAFAEWSPGPPPPQVGFDPAGEVGAAYLYTNGEPSLLATMPGTDGKLYTATFGLSSYTWTGWAPIPGWPDGARARNATVVRLQGSIWIAFRDTTASDYAPNTWLARYDSFDGWTWEQLPFPSYMTPGLTQGSDGWQYLLYSTYSGAAAGLKLASRPPGGTFAPIDQVAMPGVGLGSATVPVALRTRLQLVYVPYRYEGGTIFSDSSGYLAAYWVSGLMTDQDSWLLKRAYTPGYISTTGACFGATPSSPSCDDDGVARWRAQKMTGRPRWGISPQIALRWNEVSAVYVDSMWSPNNPAGQGARRVMYQPHANGQPYSSPAWHVDNDDAAMMRDFMCSSLRALEGDASKCNLLP